MAGRGTDIVLGGNPESEIKALENPTSAQIQAIRDAWAKRHEQVIAAGGLHIIGTERHESRRIDNQLRGRAGRQGDPGLTQFYLALEDNLMRIFAGDWLKSAMQRLGMKEGESIEHGMVSRAIEKAQRKVEGRNFDIRKQLLEFDDVANDQRRVIYSKRTDLMTAENVFDVVKSFRHDVMHAIINQFMPRDSLEEQWQIPSLENTLKETFGVSLPIQSWLEKEDALDDEAVRARIQENLDQAYAAKEAEIGATVIRPFEKSVLLQVLDNHWREHLASMDHLRQGIHWRGYAQKNPKQEYKREAYQLFSSMLESIKEEVVRILSHVQVQTHADVEQLEAQRRGATPHQLNLQHDTMGEFNNTQFEPAPQAAPFSKKVFHPEGKKVGRNDPCPCGSGKKFKQCHGAIG
jgi:preprotein translocase subunit SecA